MLETIGLVRPRLAPATGCIDNHLNKMSLPAAMPGTKKGQKGTRAAPAQDGPPAGVEPFVSQSGVRFADIDGMGHVNNAVYLSYMEEARFDWAIGIVGLDRLQAVDFVLAHVSIDYLAPARLGDTIRVEMWAPRIGEKSWDFAYRLTNADAKRVFARALSTQVAYDYQAGRSKTIPARYHDALAGLHASSEGSAE